MAMKATFSLILIATSINMILAESPRPWNEGGRNASKIFGLTDIGTDVQPSAPNNSYITDYEPKPRGHGPESFSDMVYADPLKVDEFEPYLRLLPKVVAEYVGRGAFADERTVLENRLAWDDYYLRPRYLTGGLNDVDMSTTLLGHPVQSPIGFSPTAYHLLYHPEAELGTARACAKLGNTMVISLWATTLMEDLARAVEGSNCNLWGNILLFGDRTAVLDIVERAKAAGLKALVLSLDVPYISLRDFCIRNRFDLVEGANVINIPPELDVWGDQNQTDPDATWEDVEWLVKVADPLPIVVKGIITPEDAINAVMAGVKGVWISNHGGRQLDHLPPTIDVLPDVAKALNGSGVEIYIDGGIRTGISVFKALALGARAAFIGRPVTWGLAYGGGDGVLKVAQLLNRELKKSMQLAGRPKLSQLDSSALTLAAPRCSSQLVRSQLQGLREN